MCRRFGAEYDLKLKFKDGKSKHYSNVKEVYLVFKEENIMNKLV